MAAVGLEPSANSPENLQIPPAGGAQSGALCDNPSPSLALSMLAKLVAGLTADERAALARMLEQGEGGRTQPVKT
jgi:hypothetical protein